MYVTVDLDPLYSSELKAKTTGFPWFIFIIFAGLEKSVCITPVGSAWNNECLAVCNVDECHEQDICQGKPSFLHCQVGGRINSGWAIIPATAYTHVKWFTTSFTAHLELLSSPIRMLQIQCNITGISWETDIMCSMAHCCHLNCFWTYHGTSE